MPKVVAIHSFHGSTGKSIVTANLIAAIAMRGLRNIWKQYTGYFSPQGG